MFVTKVYLALLVIIFDLLSGLPSSALLFFQMFIAVPLDLRDSPFSGTQGHYAGNELFGNIVLLCNSDLCRYRAAPVYDVLGDRVFSNVMYNAVNTILLCSLYHFQFFK